MSLEALFVFLSLIGMIVILGFDKMRPGLTLFSVAVLFMVTGIITPSEVIAGFSNKGMITVAILFLISEGVRQSGALNLLVKKLLPEKDTTIPRAMWRMLPGVATISAFLNNTAVVVIFAPIIKRWAERVNLPSQKFLIPLSFATILGGMCTLIGTSTNLVVDGMMQENGFPGLSMFELVRVGGVIAVVGIIYLIAFGNLLLPGERILPTHKKENFKEYYYDIHIPYDSRLIGTFIHNGQSEIFPQMEVKHVKRGNKIIKAAKQSIKIEGCDQIMLAGQSDKVQQLINTSGIELQCLKNADPSFIKKSTKQVEAVIGPRFPGINKTLGEFDFYRHYGALVMSIHRNGEYITGELDHLRLSEGDNLVLLTDESFITSWGQSSSFYLLSEVDDFAPRKPKLKRWCAFILLFLMICGATIGENLPSVNGIKFDMFFFAAVVMVIMACINIFPAKKYTKYISWDILIAIASAFAISKAMQNSGIADIIASNIISFAHRLGPRGVLAALFIITNIFTEIVTNNAAAALSFPIAVAVSSQLGVSPAPFFIIICIAASASFSTPIGYQTNLIVQSIGGYKFRDFVKIGLPLNIITFLISVYLIPVFWKF